MDAAEASRPAARWGLVEPTVALVLGIIGAAIGLVVATVTTGADLTEDMTLAGTVGSLAGMWAVYIAVIAYTVRARGSGSARDDLGLGVRPLDLLSGILGGLVSSVVVVQLVYVMLQLTSIVDEDDLDKLDDPAQRLGETAEGAGFLLLALFIGIGAPIVEEVFFRGFLQPAAIRRFGPVAGVIVTALVFGAVHFQVLQFPALAAFGVVLGVMAYRFRRLGPSIVAHMVFNGLTLAALAAS